MELKRLGKYQIIKLLGEGGFGTVYLAEDNIGRQVALKVLHPQIASDKLLAAYFEREAVALARLKHPNIVAISSYDQAEGTTFIEMEYVEGRTLRDILHQDEPLPLPRILKIFLQILDALSHAHAKGVIHRDIKPANIMLTPKGEVKITDFGIARVAGSEKLTQTGTGAGSLLYMSPEQIKGKGIDHRSDLYSLAISLYQVLTGKTPFSGDSDYEIMNQQLKESPPPLRQIKPDIPGELEFLILKALEKDKEDRFQSAAEMATELERVAAAPVGDVRTTEETILPRPKMRAPLPDLRRSPLWPKLAVGLAGVAVVVVAVLLLYPLGGDREEGEREGLIQQEIGITFADSLGSVIKMFNDGDYHGSFDLAKSLKESASANREDRLRLRKILAASALITGDSLAADREFSRLLADFADADFSRDEYPPEVVARWQYIRKPPVTAGDDQIANGTETGSGT
ncbi:MAG: serine/threonine protein kinase, partial [candidate division Zixibacteria bacterium]|nr:serine/threonine protein kinase [candidate division Zixibacteria bacterium]